MKSRDHVRAAFTLVELLVVVAIIAVLAALLMPAVQSAMASARGAVCRSNLRQMGQAMHMHAHDWDGYLPFYGLPANFGRPDGSGSSPERMGNGAQWDIQIMPYLGMEAWAWGQTSPPPELGLRPTVFYCSSMKPAFLDNRPTQYVWSRSYSYNRRVGENRNGSRALELLADPLRTFLLMGSVHADFEPWNDRAGPLGFGHTGSMRYQQNETTTRRHYAYRHQGLAHLLFADAHVSARPPGENFWPGGITFANGYHVYAWPEGYFD